MKLISLLAMLTYILHADISVLNKFTEQDIKKEIHQKGVKKFVIEMAKGTNDKVASQGGYVAMDFATNFVSARANNDTYISYIEISKDAIIKATAKKSNLKESSVKKNFENNDYEYMRNFVKNDLKKTNINRYCTTKEFKLMMKYGLKMKFYYSFNDGDLIDMNTITYDSCPEKTTQTSSVDKPVAISTQDTVDMNSTMLDVLKSAKEGNISAQYQIGKFYDDNNDSKKAFGWIKKAAEQGYTLAESELGFMYIFNKAINYDKKTSNDSTEAVKWFRKAAKKGNVDAQRMLGQAYELGDGVKKDYEEALRWYEKGALQGNVYLQSKLADIYYYGKLGKKDYKKAFKWYMKAAEQGDSDAQYSIGWMYAHGEWATKNLKKAFKWYRKAAEQGHTEAQYTLGDGIETYGFMTSVSEDKEKLALMWYMKAAEQGHAEAQYKVAQMYTYDRKVSSLPKDDKEALRWYMKAAKQDHPRALSIVGDMYRDGSGGLRRNHQKALQYYTKAAKKGDMLTMLYLGRVYLVGEGAFKKNYIKAYAWFSLLNENANSYFYSFHKISEKLDMLEERMTPKQLAIAQRYNPLETKDSNKVQKEGVQSSKTFTGTGFFINTSNIVTNHHVVEECRSIEIIRGEYRASAKIVVDDSRNDLAVLKAKTPNDMYLKLRAGKSIRIGEEVIVLGYPLGKLLGSGIKLTSGDVSSMTGLVDDATMMQMTAPVQPGNSGGALLDKSGNVVGVIRSRLSKTPSGRSMQNVNLAIKSNILQILLDTKNIEYDVAMSKVKKETADIADEAKTSVVQVVCHE